MKKHTLWLLAIGSMLMSFSLLTKNFFQIPEGPNDFMKGVGVAFMISSLFVQKKIGAESGGIVISGKYG
ncbi:MAG TPA: hypothetical protein PKC40_05110 [Saprospiraceae bacterium]|nr:hypothetical protein [Saprospiraceae bacterium]